MSGAFAGLSNHLVNTFRHADYSNLQKSCQGFEANQTGVEFDCLHGLEKACGKKVLAIE
jgi:hypothetical protein